MQALMENVEQVDFESLVELFKGLKCCASYLSTAQRVVALAAMLTRVSDDDRPVAVELDLAGELIEDLVSDVLHTLAAVPGVGHTLLERFGSIYFAASRRLAEREQAAGRHTAAETETPPHFSEEALANMMGGKTEGQVYASLIEEAEEMADGAAGRMPEGDDG